MGRILVGVAAILLLAALALLVTGNRILISETRVRAGQPLHEEGWSGATAEQDQLVCRYFTGRSVRTMVYWHSPNRIMGKDECPFLLNIDD